MLTFIATARFSCTSAHTSCYATARFPCTSAHTSCYARINEERQSATKNCHSCGTRSIAPNIRTIHRNSTWLRKKSNYDVQKKNTQLYFSFQQISSSKIMLFFPRDLAKKTCSPNMNLVQANIPDHANILQMLMWNQWKTLKIPWNFLLLNGCGWTWMDIHDLNICYPSANSVRLTANSPRQTQHVATMVLPSCHLHCIPQILYAYNCYCIRRIEGGAPGYKLV